jgi:hypothetical protein
MRYMITFGAFVLAMCLVAEGEASRPDIKNAKGVSSTKSSGNMSSPSVTPKKGDAHPGPVSNKGITNHLIDGKHITQTKQPTKYYPYQLKKSLNSGNLKLDPGQQAALEKLISQQPLTFDDRQQLSDLLFKGSAAGLSSEDEEALSYLLTGDMARNDGSASPPEQPPGNSSGPMYLRVVNKTKEPIKLWVQVVPSEAVAESPGKASAPEVLKYELAPGKAYDLFHKGQRLQASTVRIWAVSPTGRWAAHRDHDLALTSTNSSKVYLVTLAPAATTATQGGAVASTFGAVQLPK